MVLTLALGSYGGTDWRVGDDVHNITDTIPIKDLAGSLFVTNMSMYMSGLMPVLMSFPVERAVFLREAGSNMYGSSCAGCRGALRPLDIDPQSKR